MLLLQNPGRGQWVLLFYPNGPVAALSIDWYNILNERSSESETESWFVQHVCLGGVGGDWVGGVGGGWNHNHGVGDAGWDG